MIRFTVTERLPLPARSVLSVVMAALKTKKPAAEELIRTGHVQLKGIPLTRSHTVLEVGDMIEIDPQPDLPRKQALIPARRAPFEVLFHDEHLVVVNKPAGLLTVATPNRESNTLQAQLRKWIKGQRAGEDAICVHRLDKLVSGVLVFAKSSEVADRLRNQFADRKPDRLYRAFLRGKLARPQGTIQNYLSTDSDLHRRSSDDPQAGELAITHYQLDESWDAISLVSIQLETGRRNQIRVHMSDLGCPVLGDTRYGMELAEHPSWPYVRIALHAESLGFEHPMTKKPLRFTSNWPAEFRQLRKQLNRK